MTFTNFLCFILMFSYNKLRPLYSFVPRVKQIDYDYLKTIVTLFLETVAVVMSSVLFKGSHMLYVKVEYIHI